MRTIRLPDLGALTSLAPERRLGDRFMPELRREAFKALNGVSRPDLRRSLSASWAPPCEHFARSATGAEYPPEAGDDRSRTRFLIDECLSSDLVSVASQAGHVARIGKAGWKDWNGARPAAGGDFVVVANDASDYRRLYAAQPIHARLVTIIPSGNRLGRQRPLLGVIGELARFRDPVNHVPEVDIEGDEVTFNLYALAAPVP